MEEPRDTESTAAKTLLLRILSCTLAMEQESKVLHKFYSLKKQTDSQFFDSGEKELFRNLSEGMEIVNQRILSRLQTLS